MRRTEIISAHQCRAVPSGEDGSKHAPDRAVTGERIASSSWVWRSLQLITVRHSIPKCLYLHAGADHADWRRRNSPGFPADRSSQKVIFNGQRDHRAGELHTRQPVVASPCLKTNRALSNIGKALPQESIQSTEPVVTRQNVAPRTSKKLGERHDAVSSFDRKQTKLRRRTA